MTTTQSTRPRKPRTPKNVKLIVELDVTAWAELAKIDPDRVPADVADYFGELLATARSSYAHLITDVKLSPR